MEANLQSSLSGMYAKATRANSTVRREAGIRSVLEMDSDNLLTCADENSFSKTRGAGYLIFLGRPLVSRAAFVGLGCMANPCQ